jgi:hypothetical protein
MSLAVEESVSSLDFLSGFGITAFKLVDDVVQQDPILFLPGELKVLFGITQFSLKFLSK